MPFDSSQPFAVIRTPTPKYVYYLQGGVTYDATPPFAQATIPGFSDQTDGNTKLPTTGLPAATYVYADGQWWGRDGTGPYIVDATGTPRIAGWMTSVIAGEMALYGRMAGGAIAKGYLVTGNGLPTGWVGGGIVYDIICLIAGGNVSGLYDAASASGTNRFATALVGVANAVTPVASAGVGAIYNVSPYFTITGGTWLVMGVPVV